MFYQVYATTLERGVQHIQLYFSPTTVLSQSDIAIAQMEDGDY